MKVRIRPGMHIEVSAEMMAKAEKAFAKSAFTPTQKVAAYKLEGKVASRTLLIGKTSGKKRPISPKHALTV